MDRQTFLPCLVTACLSVLGFVLIQWARDRAAARRARSNPMTSPITGDDLARVLLALGDASPATRADLAALNTATMMALGQTQKQIGANVAGAIRTALASSLASLIDEHASAAQISGVAARVDRASGEVPAGYAPPPNLHELHEHEPTLTGQLAGDPHEDAPADRLTPIVASSVVSRAEQEILDTAPTRPRMRRDELLPPPDEPGRESAPPAKSGSTLLSARPSPPPPLFV